MIVKYENPDAVIPDHIEIGCFFVDEVKNLSIGIAKAEISSADLPTGSTEINRSELITHLNDLISNQVDVGDGLLVEAGTAEETITAWCNEHGEP